MIFKVNIEPPEWASWLAQNQDGSWYWFRDKPNIRHSVWVSTTYHTKPALNTYQRNENWEQELYKVIR